MRISSVCLPYACFVVSLSVPKPSKKLKAGRCSHSLSDLSTTFIRCHPMTSIQYRMSKPIVTNLMQENSSRWGEWRKWAASFCWLLISFGLKSLLHPWNIWFEESASYLLFPARFCSMTSNTFEPASALLTWYLFDTQQLARIIVGGNY